MNPPGNTNPPNKTIPRKTEMEKDTKEGGRGRINRTLAYKILLLLKEGQYASKISRQLNMPKSTVKDYIKRLLDNGLIKLDVESGAKFYRLTKAGHIYLSQYLGRVSRYHRGLGKTRLHRLNIKFPITKDNPNAKFGKEHNMTNWIQRYTKINYPIGITLQKNADKSIVAMFHEFETEKSRTFTDFFNHVMRGVYYVYYHLKERYDIEVNAFGIEVIDQHIANERPDLDGKLDDKKKTTISLNRKAQSYFPANFDSKAWIDFSKGIMEIETNDLLYEERLLLMPENVDRLTKSAIPVMNELRKDIQMHLQVMRDIKDVLQEMRGFFKNGK